MMRRSLLGPMVLFAIVLVGGEAAAVPRLGSAVIVRLDGEAKYVSPDGKGDVEEGMAFSQGQSITTDKDGKIVSVLTPGCVLCIAPETEVDLQQIEMTTEGLPEATKRIDKNIIVDMPQGGAMRFDAGDMSPNLNLRVKTDAGDVTASGGRAIVAKDGTSWRVICEDAFVNFEADGKQTQVKKDEVLTASPNGSGKYDIDTQPISQTGLEDQFVGCRREAERLSSVVFDVEYVGIDDLTPYIGSDITYYGDSSTWIESCPTVPNSVAKITSLNKTADGETSGRQGLDDVWEWLGDVGTIKGVNFVPSTAVNSTEMWQESTFDLDAIDDELGYAKDAGYTSVRLFLPYIVWEDDPDGLKDRMRDVLASAKKKQIGVVFVLFDDNNFAGKEAYLGEQDAPIEGVFNSQWTPSPGASLVTNKTEWASLEEYVRDIVGSFRRDKRIFFWDLYNEPGSDGMGEKSLPLVEAAFEWARDENPVRPLTVGIWSDMATRMSKTIMELSDIISFRAYENENDLRSKLLLCQTLGRPLVCTEWLRRDKKAGFEEILPIFSEYHVGWYHWGLVAGKTQTYMPFDAKKGSEKPDTWQFDVLREDGKPYNKKEIELIRNFVFEP